MNPWEGQFEGSADGRRKHIFEEITLSNNVDYCSLLKNPTVRS